MIFSMVIPISIPFLLTIKTEFISVPTAKTQAIDYNHSFTREVCFLACHSILHLLGYDHENSEETAVMQDMERQILGKAGITREHDHEGN